MQEDIDLNTELDENRSEEVNAGTLSEIAKKEMEDYVRVFWSLTRKTKAFKNVLPEHLHEFKEKLLVLRGIGSKLNPDSTSAEQVVQEWRRSQAESLPFDVESDIKDCVYLKLERRVKNLVKELEQATQGFLEFDSSYIEFHLCMLPILESLINIWTGEKENNAPFGKISLKPKQKRISKKKADEISKKLNETRSYETINCERILQEMKTRLEGIYRDSYGKIVLESLVANALDDAKITYKRESNKNKLKGFFNETKADFLIYNSDNVVDPKAFIEVRKSKPNHAHGYARSLMFSAINCKANKDILAVSVLYGSSWSSATKSAIKKEMEKVFDRVAIVDLKKGSDVAELISVAEDICAYIEGDRSHLKRIINISIDAAN